MPTSRIAVTKRGYTLLCSAQSQALVQFNDSRAGGIRVHVGPSVPDIDTKNYIRMSDTNAPLPIGGAFGENVYAKAEVNDTSVVVISS